MHVNASIEETSTSVKPSARKSKLRYMKKFIVWTDVDRLESMLTNYGVIAALLASIAFASLVSTTPEDYDALPFAGAAHRLTASSGSMRRTVTKASPTSRRKSTSRRSFLSPPFWRYEHPAWWTALCALNSLEV